MRFNLSDAISWLQPDSVYLRFSVQNDTSSDIVLADAAHCFIERVRIFAAGVPIEEITNFAKLTSMVKKFVPVNPVEELYTGATGTTIGANSTVEMGMPLSQGVIGFFNSPLLWPLRYASLTIEISLVSNAADALTTGSAFKILNPTIICQKCELNEDTEASVHSHLASGNVLPVHLKTFWNTQQSVLSSGTLNLGISKSISRLAAVWNVFTETSDKPTWFPSQGDIELSVRVGSVNYPDRPLSSKQMCLYTTLAGMNLLKPGNALHIPALTATEYLGATNASSAFITRLSMEKADEGFILSGEASLQNGAQVTVTLKNATCESITTVLEYDKLVEISNSGVAEME